MLSRCNGRATFGWRSGIRFLAGRLGGLMVYNLCWGGNPIGVPGGLDSHQGSDPDTAGMDEERPVRRAARDLPSLHGLGSRLEFVGDQR